MDEPLAMQTFSREEDRARLTPTAQKAFLSIVDRWELSNGDAAALLGVSLSNWHRIKAGRWSNTFTQDQLTRVSALVGVYKGLHLIFVDGMADCWPNLPNKGPIFDRLSPIAVMIEGGVPCMIEVRRYVDALRLD